MNILVVEDNAADARLVEAALQDHPHHRVTIVKDGMEAMGWLRREGSQSHAPRPDLILLDLNLPYKDGRAVLAECKVDPALRHIPIVVLTSTQADAEVRRAYELGAAAYCVKPLDLDAYFSLVQMIAEFWGRRARLVVGG